MFNDICSKPPSNIPLLVKCPEWCDLGYQVCQFRNGMFQFPEQPNDIFHGLVEGWMIIEED